jgi:hypothetical protein
MIFCLIAVELASWPLFALVVGGALAGTSPKIGLFAYLLIMLSPFLFVLMLALSLFWIERHQGFYIPAALVLVTFWGVFFLLKKPSVIGIAEVYANSRIDIFGRLIAQFWGA